MGCNPKYPPFLRYRDQCFGSRYAERPCWRPPYAAPRRNFKKSPRQVLILRLIWCFLQRNDSLPTKRPMPPHIAEKRQFLTNSRCFSAICGGIGGFVGKVSFLCRILQSRRRTRTGRGDFLKFLRGAAHCGRQHGRRLPYFQNIRIRRSKKWAIFWTPPKNFAQKN